ncbi:MAG: ABC transporter substrate-binding protein [Pseudomonadota bacterium]|nr:ABC transporter substrate-binding protein [Pseudomonadota bacterium]
MRLFAFALILPLAVGLAAPACADDTQADEKRAKTFVTELADEAITILKTQTTREGREAGFRKILDERANMRRIALFTLGPFARKISDEDFATYQQLLNELIIKVYANRLGEYGNEQLVVGRSQRKKNNFIINSQIEFDNGRQPIAVDWWLYREKDDSFSLFDVRVIGVWMAQEQRDSFASVLKNNRGDISALLGHIRKQIKASGGAEPTG